MPRMTNTYMLAGDKTGRDRREHQKGLYATNLWRSGGHHVGQVCVLGQRSLLVENGKILPRQAPPSSATAPTPLTRVTDGQ
jgi:predicted Zn-dependent protease